jgi:hypothetical protein
MLTTEHQEQKQLTMHAAASYLSLHRSLIPPTPLCCACHMPVSNLDSIRALMKADVKCCPTSAPQPAHHPLTFVVLRSVMCLPAVWTR